MQSLKKKTMEEIFHESLRTEVSWRELSRFYGVPKSTLRDYLSEAYANLNKESLHSICNGNIEALSMKARHKLGSLVDEAFDLISLKRMQDIAEYQNPNTDLPLIDFELYVNKPDGVEKSQKVNPLPKVGGLDVVVIADTQCKPDESLEYMLWIGNYIAETKPDVVIHIGDHWDMPSLSSYDKGTKGFEGRRVKADLEAGHTGMKLLTSCWKDIKGYSPRMVFISGNHECLTGDADVLTRDGWVNIKDLTADHTVATMDTVGDLSWQKPSCVFSKPYKGLMNRYNTRSFYLDCTEGHRTYTMKGAGKHVVTESKDLPENFKVISAVNQQKEYDISDDDLTRAANDVIFLRQYCLPNWTKDLSNRQFEIFIDGLGVGGDLYRKTVNGTVMERIFGGCLKLCEEIQMCAVLHGFTATLESLRNHRYKVKLYKKTTCKQKTKKEVYEYDGLVYCMSIENENFIVRQNGKCHVTGNCRLETLVKYQPELDGIFGLKHLNVEQYGWELIDFLKPFELEGVFFTHYVSNPFTGKPYGGTAANILKAVSRSFVAGHKQCLDFAVKPNIDGTISFGLISGAAYPHDEGYKGHQGNVHFRGITHIRNLANGFGDISFIQTETLKKNYYST